MSLQTACVGRRYPPTEPYVVSRAKIAEFARALGSTNPLHSDLGYARARGFADLVAPPTFPIIITIEAGHQAVFDPDLDLDFDHSLHGTQRFEYQRPIVAGDELQVVVTIDDITHRERNESVTLKAEVTGATGELVVTATCTIVVLPRDRA